MPEAPALGDLAAPELKSTVLALKQWFLKPAGHGVVYHLERLAWTEGRGRHQMSKCLALCSTLFRTNKLLLYPSITSAPHSEPKESLAGISAVPIL